MEKHTLLLILLVVLLEQAMASDWVLFLQDVIAFGRNVSIGFSESAVVMFMHKSAIDNSTVNSCGESMLISVLVDIKRSCVLMTQATTSQTQATTSQTQQYKLKPYAPISTFNSPTILMNEFKADTLRERESFNTTVFRTVL